MSWLDRFRHQDEQTALDPVSLDDYQRGLLAEGRSLNAKAGEIRVLYPLRPDHLQALESVIAGDSLWQSAGWKAERFDAIRRLLRDGKTIAPDDRLLADPK